MVFQSFALFPWLTVQENVELGLEARGVPRAERAEPRRGRDRPDRPRRVRKRLSEGTVRRHAPARRPGARAGGASRPAADGRAVQRARRADRGEPAHRPDRSVVGGQAAGAIGADGDAQHRGGGADVRPHPGVLLQSRPRGERAARAVPASAQSAGSGVPPVGGRHLRADDAPAGAERSRRGRTAGEHRRAAASRRHQPDGGPDGGAGGAALQRPRRPARAGGGAAIRGGRTAAARRDVAAAALRRAGGRRHQL